MKSAPPCPNCGRKMHWPRAVVCRECWGRLSERQQRDVKEWQAGHGVQQARLLALGWLR